MCVRERERGGMENEMGEEKGDRKRERERQLAEQCWRERDEAVCLCLNACHPFSIQSHLHGSGEEKIT